MSTNNVTPSNVVVVGKIAHFSFTMEKILDKLEGDVTLAAQMGQALLERHEHYMIDAERERAKMTAKIEQLEVDKRELEVKNEKIIEENKGLLDQLEGLNGSYEESELQIKLLESTLQSTHTEMKRLETLASRTHQLEKDLAILEEEQETLRKTITHTAAEERAAVLRWKRAERGLCDLQDQLEKIEREAREERERHVEILGRMERQRTVERELDTAACRLKGAAAMTTGKPHHIIHEEEDDDSNDVSGLQITDIPSLVNDFTNPTNSEVSDHMVEEWMPPQFGPSLHRSSSYESIVSISGIDIHTLRARPSQINMTSAGVFVRPRSRLSNPTSAYCMETITSASMITAQPTLSRVGQSSTTYLRSNIGYTNSSRSHSNDRSSIRSSSSNEGNNNSNGLGKKVGGWVFGRWGMSPVKSTNDLRSTSEAQNPDSSTNSSSG
ncbi:hypothetical protein DID88_009445 [Monilinia fructigena]|uniref:Uncharacterized protein n=1 Tax=Monilinia fructigena TaxID=38457 RepID=A0A395ISI0_9HELO|nr:hypothetical protein DID88_009445 [Monilinia fructigena]